jgi:hypothetical protein
VAQRLIDHFRLTGGILDPCRANGAFYDNFPEPATGARHGTAATSLHAMSHSTGLLPTPRGRRNSIGRFPGTRLRCRQRRFLARLHNAIGTYTRYQDWPSRSHGLQEIIVLNWQDAGFRVEKFVLGAIGNAAGLTVRSLPIGLIRQRTACNLNSSPLTYESGTA